MSSFRRSLFLVLSMVLVSSCKPGVTTPRVMHFIPSTAIIYGVADVATIARNTMLQDELLASYRDKLLRFVGLTAAQAQNVSGLVEFFGTSAGGAAAMVPGLAIEGAAAGTRGEHALVKLGDSALLGTRLGTASLVGDAMSLDNALDVRAGKAPPLVASPIQAMVGEAAEFKTLRAASSNAKALFGLLPGLALPTSLWARLDRAAVFMTLDGTLLTARISVSAMDVGAAQELTAWAESQRQAFRKTLTGFREVAGLFGGALDPAINALDGIRIETRGQTVWVSTAQDLKPIFSSGLMTVLRMFKTFGG